MVKEPGRQFHLSGGSEAQTDVRAHFNQQFDRCRRFRYFHFDEGGDSLGPDPAVTPPAKGGVAVPC